MTTEVAVGMHGAGNTFLVRCGDDADVSCLADEDGLLLVTRCEGDEADLAMRIINRDGSEAQQCGNGLRCIALHAMNAGLVEGPTIRIATLLRVCTCTVLGEGRVETDLGLPTLGADACGVDASLLGDLPPLYLASMGNPHAVVVVDADVQAARDELGPRVADHEAFSEGINLHAAAMDGRCCCSVASWERGVGATAASGTGCAAVLAALAEAGLADAPLEIACEGGTLMCRFGDGGEVLVTGPAAYC